jgi:hypothetical protein
MVYASLTYLAISAAVGEFDASLFTARSTRAGIAFDVVRALSGAAQVIRTTAVAEAMFVINGYSVSPVQFIGHVPLPDNATRLRIGYWLRHPPRARFYLSMTLLAPAALWLPRFS